MFSDFAVKAIINDWNEQYFGPNPFKQLGECSNQIELTFKPDVLLESPSSQLKMVAQLCEKGTAIIHALPNTIVFGVDPAVSSKDLYTIDILTYATVSQGFSPIDDKCLGLIGKKKGTVGHALVKFRSGGSMLLSAGHWIELSKIDVSLESLENVAANLYGNEYKEEIDILITPPPPGGHNIDFFKGSLSPPSQKIKLVPSKNSNNLLNYEFLNI